MNFKNHKCHIKGISLHGFGAIPGKNGFSLSPGFLPLPSKGPRLVRALLPSISEAKEISSVMMTCMAVGPLCSQGLLGGGWGGGQKLVALGGVSLRAEGCVNGPDWPPLSFSTIISPWDTLEVQVAPAFFPNANSFCSLLFLPESTWPCWSDCQHCRDWSLGLVHNPLVCTVRAPTEWFIQQKPSMSRMPTGMWGTGTEVGASSGRSGGVGHLCVVHRDTPVLFLKHCRQEGARYDARFVAHQMCFDLLQTDVFSNSPLPFFL